jgi:hypothetical protein
MEEAGRNIRPRPVVLHEVAVVHQDAAGLHPVKKLGEGGLVHDHQDIGLVHYGRAYLFV